MKLSDEDFLKIIDSTPLVSIDLIVRDQKGRILMGKRTNQPALGSWFVPGGRIIKGEDLDSAITRIGKAELGVNITRKDGRVIGIFDHVYETNYANIEGIQTQYVVIAYEFYLDLNLKKLPIDQHSEWGWISEFQANTIHENSAAYFRAVQTVDDVAYSALNARRDVFDNMLWQTPVLSLVAQAFLFTIILSASTKPGSRTIAALLALITSVASLQLLSKHRYGEKDLKIELDSIEKAAGRYRVNRYRVSENWFIKISSYRIWLAVLSAFGIAALIALLFPCLITS